MTTSGVTQVKTPRLAFLARRRLADWTDDMAFPHEEKERAMVVFDEALRKEEDPVTALINVAYSIGADIL